MISFTFFNFFHQKANLHIFRMYELLIFIFGFFCVWSAKIFLRTITLLIFYALLIYLRSTYIFTIYVYIYILLICLPTTFFVVILGKINPIFYGISYKKIWSNSQIVIYFINEIRDVFVFCFLPKSYIRVRKAEAWTINR